VIIAFLKIVVVIGLGNGWQLVECKGHLYDSGLAARINGLPRRYRDSQ
jgi:hypothetical protein